MRIALIGAAGQLGTDLQRHLSGEVVPLTHADVEVTQPDSGIGRNALWNAPAHLIPHYSPLPAPPFRLHPAVTRYYEYETTAG